MTQRLHDLAVKVAVRFKTEATRQARPGATPQERQEQLAVADYVLRAVKSYPAYLTAEQAVKDVNRDGLPAAVIRELAEGRSSAEDVIRCCVLDANQSPEGDDAWDRLARFLGEK